jgi:hypothetical protein
MGQHVTRPLVGMHSYWVMEKSVHGGESSALTTPFKGRSDMSCSTREVDGALLVETRRDDYNLYKIRHRVQLPQVTWIDAIRGRNLL